MLFQRLSKIWKPGLYQGKYHMRGYFEGWYYKLVDASERNIVAIIPGVSFDIEGHNPHAFIQLLDTTGVSARYFKYAISELWYSSKDFEIRIGSNCFSSNKIVVNAVDQTNTIRGTLKFHNITPWPVTLFSPGAMGWYAFAPFMECYHGVLSFDHLIEGTLEINGRCIDFTGGRGYMEKDWGRSFPRYHIWIQTNHFDEPGTSLAVSIANIPWLWSYFDGFMAGFKYNRIYQLTTYTGARLTAFRLEKDQLSIHISSKKYRLEIGVSEQAGIELRSPLLGDMRGTLMESLTADTHVRLFALENQQERLVFEGVGRHTGLEIAGERKDIASIKVNNRF